MAVEAREIDVEALVINVLLADAGVISVVSNHVYPELPKGEVAYPLLMVRRIGGPPHYTGWITRARIQVDSMAKSKGLAFDAASAAQFAILNMSGRYDEGVVTSLQPEVGMFYLPDKPTGYPKYTFDLIVHAHPVLA